MDFKPEAAVLRSDAPHTGPYAVGSSLSFGPDLKPLDPAPEKTIQLDTVDRLIDLAPGVKYDAWTFGGQVPGPTIRARQGDLIHFSMTNRSNERLPGSPEFTAPMMHSMDFHAAMVGPDDKYRSIAPGQTISFSFHCNYPGVFMYHCGTPMILEHIASGMYGMMIVEPRGGFPTKVDREYVIVQSEFYTRPNDDKRKVGGVLVYTLDSDKVRKKESSYTVFNGSYNGFVQHPLPAKPGERVRLYVLNVGPSNTSSFHVVGTIFDRVWLDGNPDNQSRGRQTILLGSACSAIVEFRIPEKGQYVMVDHHFANASQGAVGVIDARGDAPGGPVEHHNIPATQAQPDTPQAAAGKLIYDSKCVACHSIGKGILIGPDLYGVSRRHDDPWLHRWLTDPHSMLQTDPQAKTLLRKFQIEMPNQRLTPTDMVNIIAFFHWMDAHPLPQAPPAPTSSSPESTGASPSEGESSTP